MDFPKLIRLLAPIMVEGILSVRLDSHKRLVESLHELEFVTRSVTVSADRVVVVLQILDKDLLNRLLAGEANKFLLASMVSHARSEQTQANNASWQAVEHYYAAYYGVHYLLRLIGTSVTNLDQRSINSILRSGLGANFQSVPGGLYVMQYDSQTDILTLTKNTKRGPGGSHQDAWRLWEAFIDNLRSLTAIDPVEYASVDNDLALHKSTLSRSTSHYNPPEVRGEINYQFKGGSWVFEKNAKDSIDRIQRLITSTTVISTASASTPEGLIACNKIIIGLAKAIFKHASDKYPKSIGRSLANKFSAYIT